VLVQCCLLEAFAYVFTLTYGNPLSGCKLMFYIFRRYLLRLPNRKHQVVASKQITFQDAKQDERPARVKTQRIWRSWGQLCFDLLALLIIHTCGDELESFLSIKWAAQNAMAYGASWSSALPWSALLVAYYFHLACSQVLQQTSFGTWWHEVIWWTAPFIIHRSM